jgi:hypothetical protein
MAMTLVRTFAVSLRVNSALFGSDICSMAPQAPVSSSLRS